MIYFGIHIYRQITKKSLRLIFKADGVLVCIKQTGFAVWYALATCPTCSTVFEKQGLRSEVCTFFLKFCSYLLARMISSTQVSMPIHCPLAY